MLLAANARMNAISKTLGRCPPGGARSMAVARISIHRRASLRVLVLLRSRVWIQTLRVKDTPQFRRLRQVPNIVPGRSRARRRSPKPLRSLTFEARRVESVRHALVATPSDTGGHVGAVRPAGDLPRRYAGPGHRSLQDQGGRMGRHDRGAEKSRAQGDELERLQLRLQDDGGRLP